MLPGLLAILIYQAMTALEVFEVPGILGLPSEIYVFSTKIYSILHGTDVIPAYGQANALAMVYLVIAVAATWFYARVIGHSDVAPARKTDPGELFPWERLANEGIGVWPNHVKANGDFTANLKRFGYGLPPDSDVTEKDVITAFQRHFRSARMDGVADDECAQILSGLLT